MYDLPKYGLWQHAVTRRVYVRRSGEVGEGRAGQPEVVHPGDLLLVGEADGRGRGDGSTGKL